MKMTISTTELANKTGIDHFRVGDKITFPDNPDVAYTVKNINYASVTLER